MSWVVGLVWGIALLVAVIVLGICAFELRWKAKRLSKDLDGMQALRDELVSLQGRLAAAQLRLSRRLSE